MIVLAHPPSLSHPLSPLLPAIDSHSILIGGRGGRNVSYYDEQEDPETVWAHEAWGPEEEGKH
jgi:hypothetical protein